MGYHSDLRPTARTGAIALVTTPVPAPFVAIMLAGAACVPAGSAPPYDAGPSPVVVATYKPSTNVMTSSFEDDFARSDAAPDAGGAVPFLDAAALSQHAGNPARGAAEAGADAWLEPDAGIADAGDRKPAVGNLGPNWTAMRTSAWKIENGRLCGEGARNHTVWLNRTLPVNARIEFDAYAMSDDGDLKAEVWGDGHSYATGNSYTNATSYLVVLGGWRNSIHALARLNEHGSDRKEIHVDKDSDDPRQRAVSRNQPYHFLIERTDGKTIRYSVNGIEYLTWMDTNPLAGQGHDHFGFNDWEAKVCFDNVKVTPLPP